MSLHGLSYTLELEGQTRTLIPTRCVAHVGGEFDGNLDLEFQPTLGVDAEDLLGLWVRAPGHCLTNVLGCSPKGGQLGLSLLVEEWRETPPEVGQLLELVWQGAAGETPLGTIPLQELIREA